VRALIELAVNLRSSLKGDLEIDSQLTISVLWLGDFLLTTKNAPKTKVLQNLATKVYNTLIKGHVKAKELLLASKDSLFSILQMGKLLRDTPGDEAISERLTEASNSVAFNDKRLTALTDIHFFKSFFGQLSEDLFLNKILPAAQVTVRRDEIFLNNLAFLVESLSFKVSAEAAKQLTTEILTLEGLKKEDANLERLLSGVCARLDDSAVQTFEN